ncbi:MAG: Fe(II)-dependent oxygenase superfamily protein [Rhizobacter sp.]|nr:Fe(II)-dependent oxygenase superfamily protein [Rhizobacter sp.]
MNRLLDVGEPAPWFVCASTANDRYIFSSAAGRHVVLAFFGSAQTAFGQRLLAWAEALCDLFNDEGVSFFGVCTDPADRDQQRVVPRSSGIRHFWDFDKAVSTSYGALNEAGAPRPVVYVLDPMLRVVHRCTFDNEDDWTGLAIRLAELPQPETPYPARLQAPVLCVPHVFEPELCHTLVRYYRSLGGKDSGFMRQIGDKTVGVYDYAVKRRRDCRIDDEALRRSCMVRIHNRLLPQIRTAFQFKATRMERYIVACYDAEEQGHFRAHRDNTTPVTAHRQFAVSLFLNTGEYDGGELRFPEFGNARYSAPSGGAVVFSCSLLHEASAVTRGRRYMFLPFLYDDAAALQREKSAHLVENAVPPDGGLRA